MTMRNQWLIATLLLAASQTSAAVSPRQSHTCRTKISPKVMIISMFHSEADVWYDNLPSSGRGDLLAQNISVPGLSPIYPEVHCVASGEICQVTAGESEINAATSIASLLLSTKFDFTSTYFLLSGIAGVSPKLGTTGSVALSKFSVQVAQQYELDAREMPENFTTGYVGYDNHSPGEYPNSQYGTEVMELNEALRDAAFELASKANLSDSSAAAEYRANYLIGGDVYTAGATVPNIIKCDTATSDVFYSGNLLSEAFENTTRVWTNQTDLTYCMTAQEDSAVLQAIMRADLAGLADYSRAILLRTGSDFDRPPPNVSAYDHLLIVDQNGFNIAVENIYNAGIEIVKGITDSWNSIFAAGIAPTNYVGDIFGSLGGEPNFGPGSVFNGEGAKADGKSYSGYIKRSKFGKRGARMK
ncbi:purine nucleoside permease [Xylariales sp. AK1849]|nr:purine nucleoside permease [Xylariales sp. AK1849]